jgi:glycosyltransferase involved in cell wall biosynthesis
LNTQDTIAEVISKTKKYVDEVIVVNDGSKDLTAEIAHLAGAKVINHEINRGKGAAIKTAMSQVKADIVVFIDGDGQHNPDDIPKLLEPITSGDADFVIGSRFLPNSKISSHHFIRKAANYMASFGISFMISFIEPSIRFVCGKSHSPQTPINRKLNKDKPNHQIGNYRLLNERLKWVSDCTSGFTAMKKLNYSKLNLISNGFEFETEIIFEQAKNGFVIAETPISCIYGQENSNLSIARDGIKTVVLLLRKSISYSNNLANN